MSADLQWLVLRNNSSFLMKKKHCTFSKEPNNLKNINRYRLNGLVHRKTIGVEPASDGKGVVMVTRNNTNWRKPGKNYTRVELKRDSRRTMNTIRKTLRNSRYRKDLKMPAVRRASAILRSQKPVVLKKPTSKKKD